MVLYVRTARKVVKNAQTLIYVHSVMMDNFYIMEIVWIHVPLIYRSKTVLFVKIVVVFALNVLRLLIIAQSVLKEKCYIKENANKYAQQVQL